MTIILVFSSSPHLLDFITCGILWHVCVHGVCPTQQTILNKNEGTYNPTNEQSPGWGLTLYQKTHYVRQNKNKCVFSDNIITRLQ